MESGAQRTGRRELIDTAERLIAEQGPAVSLRQVVTAAGQRNSAAIRYHFGTREGLIAAVVDERQTLFEPRRLEMLTALEVSDEVTPRALLEALLTPVFDHQRAPMPSYHARFMEKIRDFPGVVLTHRRDWTATTLILHRLTSAEVEAPTEVRAARTRGLISVVFALLADLEREPFSTPGARTVAEQTTLDMILGVILSSAPRASAPQP